MHKTALFTLLCAVFTVATTLATLQRVCELAENENNKLQLDYDNKSAIVNVSLLNKSKHYTSYKIHLFADWNHHFEAEEVACQNDHLLPHTVYDINSQNDFLVSLRYIYSGFYRLTIVPWINNSISFKSINVHFIVSTSLSPTVVQNWTTQFIIHPLPKFSSIVIQFLPAATEYDFNWYEVLLSECDPSSFSISAGHTLVRHANGSKPECTFENLTAGKYCAFVRPLDHRCNNGNVWQVKDLCIVHSDVIELSDPPPSRNVEWISRGSVLNVEDHSASYILVAVMISLLVVSALVGVIVCHFAKRRLNGLVSHQKLSVIRSTTPPTDNEQKNILLLWFRDNTQLMQQVELLKRDFANHFNAKILDIYDEELYDELSVDPINWLNKTTASHDLRILVIGSPKMEHLLTNAMPFETELDTLEGLVLYAVKQLWLRKVASHSLYSTTFFARFSNIPCEGHAYTSELTPFRCFMLPMHFPELLLYIKS